VQLTVSGPGTQVVTNHTSSRQLWLMTDMDLWFAGGANGDLTWSFNGYQVLDWRPGSENVQSEHWHGMQCLRGGDEWQFSCTGGPFELVGWAYVLPDHYG
jgi:hypothetical protein